MPVNLYETGKNIEKQMREKGLTAQQLSIDMHVTIQCVYKWIRGKSLPDIDHLIELAEILGVAIEELLISD